jgi:hypothetical protein
MIPVIANEAVPRLRMLVMSVDVVEKMSDSVKDFVETETGALVLAI